MDFYFYFYKNTEFFYCYSGWSSLAVVNQPWPTETVRHCFHHELVYPWSLKSKNSFWLRTSAFCYLLLLRLNGSILKARGVIWHIDITPFKLLLSHLYDSWRQTSLRKFYFDWNALAATCQVFNPNCLLLWFSIAGKRDTLKHLFKFAKKSE